MHTCIATYVATYVYAITVGLTVIEMLDKIVLICFSELNICK